MKIGEIRDLAVEDLQARAKDLDDQLFRLRIQKSMGQLERRPSCARCAAIWRGSRRFSASGGSR
jgi:ribosomal protein L29